MGSHIRAVVLKFNSRLALKSVQRNDLHNNAEPLGPEQSPPNHACYGIYFPAHSAFLSSIEVNSTWIFFWISKRLISFA